MSKVRIEVNYEGVGKLLKSSEMQSMLSGIASKVADNAGNEYLYDTKLIGTRYTASVYTKSREAIKDEMENNTLIKAMHL